LFKDEEPEHSATLGTREKQKSVFTLFSKACNSRLQNEAVQGRQLWEKTLPIVAQLRLPTKKGKHCETDQQT